MITDGQKKLMVANLKKFDKDDPVESGKKKVKINVNHVKFLLGFIKSKPAAMTEDYERALDTLFWAISGNKISNAKFGAESYNIGKNEIQRLFREKDEEEAPSKRAELKEKKEGLAPDIAPKYEEGNIKCYLIDKVDSNLSEEEQKEKTAYRHKLLCKYGKDTGWCTASPSGKIGRAHV